MQKTFNYPQQNRNPIILERPRKQLRKTAEEMTAKFLEFHYKNQNVYAHFKRIAHEMYRKGYEKFSAKAVAEIYRWQTFDAKADEKFKLCNDHSAFYARLLACDLQEYRHWFSFKKGKPDNAEFYAWLMNETGCGDPVAIFKKEGE